MDAYQDELFRRELVLIAELIKLLGREHNKIFKEKNEFGHVRDKIVEKFGLEERVTILDKVFHNLSQDRLSYEFVKCDGISPEMLANYHEFCETYYDGEHNIYSNVSALYDDSKGKCYAIVPRDEYEIFRSFILERYRIKLDPLDKGRNDDDLDWSEQETENQQTNEEISLDKAAKEDAGHTYDFEIEGAEDMDPDTFFEVQKAISDEKDEIGEDAKKINVSVQSDENGTHQITIQADNGYEKTILPGSPANTQEFVSSYEAPRFENAEEITRAVQSMQDSYNACMENAQNSLSNGTQKDAIQSVSDLTQVVYDSKEVLDAAKAYADSHPDEDISKLINTAQSVYDASSVSQAASIIAQENDRMAELYERQEMLKSATDLSYARQMLELSSINEERLRIEQSVERAKAAYEERSYSLSGINPDMQVFSADYLRNTGRSEFNSYSVSDSKLHENTDQTYSYINSALSEVKQSTVNSMRQIREAGTDTYRSAIAGALSGTVSNVERAASAYAVQTGQMGSYAQAVNTGAISGNGYYSYNRAEGETAKMQDRKSSFASSARAMYGTETQPEKYGSAAFGLLTRTPNVDKEGLGQATVSLAFSPMEKIKEDAYGQGKKKTDPYYSKMNAAIHAASSCAGTLVLADSLSKENRCSFETVQDELKRTGLLKDGIKLSFNDSKNAKQSFELISTLAEKKGIITKMKDGSYNIKTLQNMSNRELVVKMLGDRGIDGKTINTLGRDLRKMIEQDNFNKKFALRPNRVPMKVSKALYKNVTDDAGKDGYMQVKAQTQAIIKSGQVMKKGVEVSIEKAKKSKVYKEAGKKYDEWAQKNGKRTRAKIKEDKEKAAKKKDRHNRAKKRLRDEKKNQLKKRAKDTVARNFKKFEQRHKVAGKAARHTSDAAKKYAKGIGKAIGAPGRAKRVIINRLLNTKAGKFVMTALSKYNFLTQFINKLKMKLYKLIGSAMLTIFKIVVIMMVLIVIITTVCNMFESWQQEVRFKKFYDFIRDAELKWQDAIFEYGEPDKEYQVGQFKYGAGFESLENYASKIEDLTGNGYTFECGNDNGQKFIYAPIPFEGATDDMRKHMAYIDGGHDTEIHNASGTWGNTSNLKEILSMLEIYDEIETNPETIKKNRYPSDCNITSPTDDTSMVKLNLPSAKITRLSNGTIKETPANHENIMVPDPPVVTTSGNRVDIDYGYIRYLFDATHQEQVDLQFTTNQTKGSIIENNPDSIQADAVRSTDDGAETITLGIDYCPGPVGEEKTKWGSDKDLFGNEYGLYGCTSYDNFYYNRDGYISDKFDSEKNFHTTVKERISNDAVTERYDCCITPEFSPFLTSEAKQKLTDTKLTNYIFTNFGDCYKIYSVNKERVDDKPSGSVSLGSMELWLNKQDFKGKSDIEKYVSLKQNDKNTITLVGRSSKHTIHHKNHDDEHYYNKYTITIKRVCTGNHTGYYCGGHLKAKVTGLVYGMTEAQTDLDNQVIIEKVSEKEYTRSISKGQTVFASGKGARDILYCNDIFDVDSLLEHGYVTKYWTGWNEGNMCLAANRVAQDWAALYGLEYGGGTVIAGTPYSEEEIEQIIEYNKKIYPVTFTDRRQKLLREALGHVGKMGYSMNHHTCKFYEPCGLSSAGVWCRYTDCSGFASNLWTPEISSIQSTVGLKSFGDSTGYQKHLKFGGQDKFTDNLIPGDIILKYKGANNANGGGNHAMIYMGYNPLDGYKRYRIHARGAKYGVVADDGVPNDWSGSDMMWSIYPDGLNGEWTSKQNLARDAYDEIIHEKYGDNPFEDYEDTSGMSTMYN